MYLLNYIYVIGQEMIYFYSYTSYLLPPDNPTPNQSNHTKIWSKFWAKGCLLNSHFSFRF